MQTNTRNLHQRVTRRAIFRLKIAADCDEKFQECLSGVLATLKLTKWHDFQYKEEQFKSIRNLYFMRDVLAIMPTGFGKS